MESRSSPDPADTAASIAAAEARLAACGAGDAACAALLDERTRAYAARYDAQIENFIGSVSVPLGIVGPLAIHGTGGRTWACRMPLATSEGALVASYGRGVKVMNEAGGCDALVLHQEIARTPVFTFDSLPEAAAFARWLASAFPLACRAAATTTSHGTLLRVTPTIEGSNVFLTFAYHTAEAAGQNMVTIATAAACAVLRAEYPERIRSFCIEGNFSSDKKASAQSLLGTRGRRVCAEVLLPETLVEKRLHTTAHEIADYWRLAIVGASMSGQIGMQGHYANALAALYIATGQDAACVAESAIGMTRFSAEGGDLRASVTLPNVVVGSVGGGTSLPTQQAARALMGLPRERTADALAEAAAALCLAGEISIAAAMCADQFSDAHERLGRRAPAVSA